MRTHHRRKALLALTCSTAALLAAHASTAHPDVPRWGVFETAFTATRNSPNPLQDTELRVTFTSPSRQTRTVAGFWDGGVTWRVRFSPDEPGRWTYATSAAPESDGGLHAQQGTFRVVRPKGRTRFDR